MTVAFGTLSRLEHRFTAEIVHAGDSVSGERIDAIHGNIVSRSGNQLTVKGAFAVNRDHVMRVHRTVLVNVGANTKVLKTGSPGSVLDASALSVGQQIVAFGTLTEPATDTTPATFDATNGRVRMLPTYLHGAVNAVVPGQLNLNLRGIDRLGIDAFDFTGTGVTPAQDANPADYEVATGTLGLASVVAGEAAQRRRLRAPVRRRAARLRGPHRHRPSRAAGTARHRLGHLGHDGAVLEHGRDADSCSTSTTRASARGTRCIVGMRIVDLTTLPMPPTLAPPPRRARGLRHLGRRRHSAVRLVRRVQLGARRAARRRPRAPSR